MRTPLTTPLLTTEIVAQHKHSDNGTIASLGTTVNLSSDGGHFRLPPPAGAGPSAEDSFNRSLG